jgi:hypothetical protein
MDKFLLKAFLWITFFFKILRNIIVDPINKLLVAHPSQAQWQKTSW